LAQCVGNGAFCRHERAPGILCKNLERSSFTVAKASDVPDSRSRWAEHIVDWLPSESLFELFWSGLRPEHRIAQDVPRRIRVVRRIASLERIELPREERVRSEGTRPDNHAAIQLPPRP
jgi:hypothetical protein